MKKREENDKIKKSVQAPSACALTRLRMLLLLPMVLLFISSVNVRILDILYIIPFYLVNKVIKIKFNYFNQCSDSLNFLRLESSYTIFIFSSVFVQCVFYEFKHDIPSSLQNTLFSTLHPFCVTNVNYTTLLSSRYRPKCKFKIN